jgi:hypothetical protein
MIRFRDCDPDRREGVAEQVWTPARRINPSQQQLIVRGALLLLLFLLLRCIVIP